jgi:oligoribonuclease NrnB/cAMP/cGMP phosphodiesterase (DHH superfamily)
MIDLDKLKKVKTIYYHASCPDGTASAIICAEALSSFWDIEDQNSEPEFIPVQYGSNEFENLKPDYDQLFVDITPPRNRWEEWIPFNPIVLDHHESSKHVVLGLNGVYGENTTHSGARLVFEEIMLNIFDPTCVNFNIEFFDNFSNLAMIRDTWKDYHPRWEEACIQSYGLMSLGLDDILERMGEGEDWSKLVISLGKKSLNKAKFVAKNSSTYEFSFPKKFSISAINCTEKNIISDACNLMLDSGSDIALSYFNTSMDGSVRTVVSVRTKEISASKISESFGGGGHEFAAGFMISDSGSISQNEIAKLVYDAACRI